jgi:signal transduction histidine kinase
MKDNHLLTLLFATILITLLSLTGCKDDTTCPTCPNLQDTLKIIDSINNFERNKQIAVTAVHNQASLIGYFCETITDTQARKEFIQKSIDSVFFYSDRSGYFYVYDFDCICIAHATDKEKPGQNLYDYQDTHGKYVIRELSAAAQSGGGFVEFYWHKPTTQEEFKKLGYVEPIPNTNYFIGSGVYLE